MLLPLVVISLSPPTGAVMARENLESIIGDLKARMKTIRDSL
jgi:hypothetical protein